MHSTSPTSAEGPSDAEAFRATAALLVVAAIVTATVGLIVLRPGIEAVADQTFIGYRFSQGYPHFEEGIVSYLLAGLVNSVVPYDPVTTNTVVRAVASLLYTTAAGLLAWSVTGPRRFWSFVAFLLLIVTSRFPFLWLSSELFVGAFLMLFLWSLVREHPTAVTGAFVVLFGLAKAEMALPALLIGAYLVLRAGPEPRWKRAAVIGGLALLLVVPSLGVESYYAQHGGRSWVSFRQHYGELLRRHQWIPGPPGFGGGIHYVEQVFPAARSVVEVMTRYPGAYLDFVALSITGSAARTLPTKLAFLIPLAALLFPRMRRSWQLCVLLFLSNLVPIFLVAYMHVRYQARFYPLVLFVIFAALRHRSPDPRYRRAVWSVLAVVLLWQAVELLPVLETAHWRLD